MKAAVFKGIRNMAVEEVPDPELGPDDVIARVHACGICGSDLHSYTQGSFVKPGQVMGHEFAATIVQVGDAVKDLQLGDRITASPIVPCMSCARCAEGRYNLCPQAWTAGIAYGRPGAFAELVKIPRPVVGENVFKLDDMSDDAGALVEPLAVAVHAVKLAEPVEGGTALVLGLGTIGQQVVQALRGRGAGRILGTDLSALRLGAAAKLGAETIDGSQGLDEALSSALGDADVDVIFECSGVPALVLTAIERVKAGGTIVVLALYDDPVTFNPTLLVQKEIRVQGSIAYTGEDFADAVELLRSGRAQTEPLITHRESLEKVSEAFTVQLQKDQSIKVLVTP